LPTPSVRAIDCSSRLPANGRRGTASDKNGTRAPFTVGVPGCGFLYSPRNYRKSAENSAQTE
jgi:hypothetical protein